LINNLRIQFFEGAKTNLHFVPLRGVNHPTYTSKFTCIFHATTLQTGRMCFFFGEVGSVLWRTSGQRFGLRCCCGKRMGFWSREEVIKLVTLNTHGYGVHGAC